MGSSRAGDAPAASAGTTLGRYEIIAPIGRGGMGEVYRARDTQLRRDVALKILRPEYNREPDRLRRFESEARAMSRVSHANVVAVYDVGHHEETDYLVTELLEGRTLRTLLADGPLEARTAVAYAVQIARGLSAAHEKGVVHRDLKPANVFVTTQGEVKILDFGVAKLSRPADWHLDVHDSTMTAEGMLVGTVSYMAPEQLEGAPADARSDIFAFGAILYEMLAGARAFGGSSPASIAAAILREEPRPFPVRDGRISPPLQSIVRRCLEKSPEARFQSARDLAFALEQEVRLIAPVPARRLRPSRALATRLAILGAATIVAVGASLVSLRTSPSNDESPRADRVSVRKLIDRGRFAGMAISPDRRFLAYGAPGPEAQEIHLQHLPTGNDIAILSEKATHALYVRAFSPDGNYIFYRESRRDTEAIKRISVVGGEPVTVAIRPRTSASFGISPDGLKVAYGTIANLPIGGAEVRHIQVFVAASDGRGERLLGAVPAPSGVVWDLAWSPDGGTVIATVSLPLGFAWAGVVVPPAGGKPVQTPGLLAFDVATGAVRSLYLPESHRPLAASWMPDGRGLVVTSHDSDLLFLSWPEGRIQFIPGVSLRLAFARVIDETTLAGITTGDDINLWLVDGSTGTPNRLSYVANSAEGRSGLARLGRDRVVFTVQHSLTSIALWTSRIDGTDRRQLTHPPAGVTHEQVAASPNGEVIVFIEVLNAGQSHQTRRLMRMTLASGEMRPLATGPAISNPSITPDGKAVIYNRVHATQTEAFRIPIEGGTPQLISGDCYSWGVDPTGRFMACCDHKSVEYVVPVEGGKPVWRGDLAATVMRWTPEGALSFFEQGATNLWVQSLNADAPRQKTFFSSETIYDFAWSGSDILLSRGSPRRDAVLITGVRVPGGE